MKLIVIAGVSGAGKSSLARRVSQEFSVPHYEFDRLFNCMEKPFEISEIGTSEERKELRKLVAGEIVLEVLECLMSFNVTAVVEGSWLPVEEVKSRSGQANKLLPLFLGYEGSGEQRLKKFRQGSTHWTAGKELLLEEENRVTKFLDKQIQKSVKLRCDCQRYGLKYIDTTYDAGFDEAFQYLESEIKKLKTRRDFAL